VRPLLPACPEDLRPEPDIGLKARKEHLDRDFRRTRVKTTISVFWEMACSVGEREFFPVTGGRRFR